MYAEESRAAAVLPINETSQSNAPLPPDSGPALELLELANGELIWYV